MKVKTLQKLLEACDPESEVRIEPRDIDEIGKMWCLFEKGELDRMPTLELVQATITSVSKHMGEEQINLIDLRIDIQYDPMIPPIDGEYFDEHYEIKKK